MCKTMATETEFRRGVIPHLFRCPISLDLMSDPVTVCTGQTYDRMSIERWLGTGNQTCPVTRQPLGKGLIPNHTLLRLIRGWGKSGNITPKEVSALVGDIVSHDSTKTEKIEALQRLSVGLVRESEENRRFIISGTPDLVPALLLGTFSRSGIQTEALGVLVLLPLTKTQLDSIAESPLHLDILSEFLYHHNAEVCANAALIIEVLTTSDPTCVVLGCTSGLINGLVRLISLGPAKTAICALFSTCLLSSNRAAAVAAGAHTALLNCLFCDSLNRSDSERVLATLELLCKTAEGRESIAQNALATPIMKKVILKVSNQASESAAAVLLAVCAGSESAQTEALSEGVFTQLLLLLQSECSPRAKKKARALLKLLRENWPRHYCIRETIARSDVIPF